MTSPVIDEDVMIEALKPAAPEMIGENAVRLRTGATLLMLDAFDRRVTRDQFIAAIGASAELIDMIGRYETMNAVKSFEIRNGRVTKADIEATLGGIERNIAKYTEQCAKMAELIHQCALDEDKVH